MKTSVAWMKRREKRIQEINSIRPAGQSLGHIVLGHQCLTHQHRIGACLHGPVLVGAAERAGSNSTPWRTCHW
jgi:hypothetical protein